MRRATLLYDRDCGFCRWTVARALRRDHDLELSAVAIQSHEGQGLVAPVPQEKRLESWHLVLSDGQLYSGGEAFGPLLRLLRRPGQAWLLERLPAVSNWGYRAVAGRRSLLGSLVSGAARRRADETIAEHAGEHDPGSPEQPEPGRADPPTAADPPARPATPDAAGRRRRSRRNCRSRRSHRSGRRQGRPSPFARLALRAPL